MKPSPFPVPPSFLTHTTPHQRPHNTQATTHTIIMDFVNKVVHKMQRESCNYTVGRLRHSRPRRPTSLLELHSAAPY